MLLKWNPDRILTIPLILTPETAKKGLKPTRSTVRLFPGVNEIADEEFEIAKPHLGLHLGKTLEVIAEKTQPAPGKPVKTATRLKDLTAKKARELIGQTNSPDTLNKWLNEETREEIRLMITKQMEKLKIDKKDDSKDGLGPETSEDSGSDEDGQKDKE